MDNKLTNEELIALKEYAIDLSISGAGNKVSKVVPKLIDEILELRAELDEVKTELK